MAPIVLRVKGEDFTPFEGIESGEELARTWKVFTKVKDALEGGCRLENLSWRLWHLHHQLVESHQMDDSQFRKLTKGYSRKLGREGSPIESPRRPLIDTFPKTDEKKRAEPVQPKPQQVQQVIPQDSATMERQLYKQYEQLMQSHQQHSYKLQRQAENDRLLHAQHDEFLAQQQYLNSRNALLCEQESQLNSFLIPECSTTLSPMISFSNGSSDLQLIDPELALTMSSDSSNASMMMNFSNLQLSPLLNPSSYMDQSEFGNLPSDLESWTIPHTPMLGFEFANFSTPSDQSNTLLPLPWYMENVTLPEQSTYIPEIPISSPLPQLSPQRTSVKSPKPKFHKVINHTPKSSKVSKKQKEAPVIVESKDKQANRTPSSAVMKLGQTACCQNCFVTTTPLWRRSQDDELLCNACGLYLKLHKVMRPKTMRTQIARKDQNGEQLATCYNCRTKNTPLWRRDNDGNTLCNACGLYLKLHSQHRPVSLKTDIPRKRPRLSEDDGEYEDIKEHPKMKLEVEQMPANDVKPSIGWGY